MIDSATAESPSLPDWCPDDPGVAAICKGVALLVPPWLEFHWDWAPRRAWGGDRFRVHVRAGQTYRNFVEVAAADVPPVVLRAKRADFARHLACRLVSEHAAGWVGLRAEVVAGVIRDA